MEFGKHHTRLNNFVDEKIFKHYAKDYTFKAANTWEYSGFSFSFDYTYIILISLFWGTSRPTGITIASSSTTLDNKIFSQIEISLSEAIRLISFVQKNITVYFWYKAGNIGHIIANHYILPISYRQA